MKSIHFLYFIIFFKINNVFSNFSPELTWACRTRTRCEVSLLFPLLSWHWGQKQTADWGRSSSHAQLCPSPSLYYLQQQVSCGEVVTSPPLNRKVGCSRPTMIRARCLRVKQHYPAQKNNQKKLHVVLNQGHNSGSP